MAVRIVEFSCGGFKIRNILPKNQHTQRKLLKLGIGLMGKCQKGPKLDFQNSIFFHQLRLRFFHNINYFQK